MSSIALGDFVAYWGFCRHKNMPKATSGSTVNGRETTSYLINVAGTQKSALTTSVAPTILRLGTDAFPANTSSVQGMGQAPTELTGAEANSVDDPTAQKRSTGWPSQPQRPPGSAQLAPAFSTTHVPLPAQPIAPVNPQR
jgi:hypothetical protein